jgi:hypothetical protein
MTFGHSCPGLHLSRASGALDWTMLRIVYCLAFSVQRFNHPVAHFVRATPPGEGNLKHVALHATQKNTVTRIAEFLFRTKPIPL